MMNRIVPLLLSSLVFTSSAMASECIDYVEDAAWATMEKNGESFLGSEVGFVELIPATKNNVETYVFDVQGYDENLVASTRIYRVSIDMPNQCKVLNIEELAR